VLHCRCAGHVTFFWNGNRSGYLDPKLEKFEEVRCADVALTWRRGS
jgi:2,3-bisphosphoglycerate-independent phosphoglycerate mutase